jgi:hypothetical protein
VPDTDTASDVEDTTDTVADDDGSSRHSLSDGFLLSCVHVIAASRNDRSAHCTVHVDVANATVGSLHEMTNTADVDELHVVV